MKERGTGGFLHPEKILKQLNIRDKIDVADFGCGRGYFSIPLAKMIPNGVVYALDVVEEALQAVQAKAEMEKITNIQTIRSNLEVPNNSGLDDQSVDLVILANILFQSKKKKKIIREAKRVLKNNGSIAIIDWIAKATLAPKIGWRMVSKKKAQRLAEEEGLNLERELAIDDNQHYGLVFKK